jgi:predicted metal-dependent phosphoesterase TrpH/glycosyltransferase involved in cell wall biosynthesis
MGLRICLVTPFSWSRPHEANEHVSGVAAELRALGHDVTVLAPSTRAADVRAGRRALLDGGGAEVITIAPAVPVSRRSRLGVPVGVRATLELALARGEYDLVHGIEPGLPSLSYLALRDARALTVAAFLSADRLTYPPGKAQRDRLLARLDALVAVDETVAEAASARFPGEYLLTGEGVDPERFRPGAKRNLIVVEWRQTGRPVVRAALRMLRELPGWEIDVLRTKPLAGRPYVPGDLLDRVTVTRARGETARAPLLAPAAVFVPAPGGSRRVLLEAMASGAAIASPPGVVEQPELAAAAMARLAEHDAFRERKGAEARAEAERQSFASVAAELDALYRRLAGRRRPGVARRDGDPLGDRGWILADLHMHTSASHDCGVEVEDLLERAEGIGLGAIAVTDHNVFEGAERAVDLARGRDLIVIPGEEVKTAGQGEVIGLFLSQSIPRGMSFSDTIAAIREQDGIVYLPHPFDRLHSIPDAATLRRHVHDVDVLEVYNARLLFEAYNDEALRFARKYNLLMGAGSDAHVLQGVGTGALRMHPFEGPEEFLLSLRTAQVVRRPRSLVVLQGLKWVAQAREKVR